VADLWNDPLVRFQNRFYFSIAILAGFVFPFCIGTLWHDPVGALILAGFARIVLNHHFTFSINPSVITWDHSLIPIKIHRETAGSPLFLPTARVITIITTHSHRITEMEPSPISGTRQNG